MVSSEDSAWDVPPSIFGTRAGGPTFTAIGVGRVFGFSSRKATITAKHAAAAIGTT